MKKRIIDGARTAHMGAMEKNAGVDIVLKEADYANTCLTFLRCVRNGCVCMTNMDRTRPSV